MARRYQFGSKARDDCWFAGRFDAHQAGRGRLPICPHCGIAVQPADPWDRCHVGAPRWAGGKVMRPGHRRCNQLHNHRVDTPAFAKSERLIRRPKARHPLPSGPLTGRVRGVNGRVKPWVSAAQKHARAVAGRAIGAAP